MRPGPLSSLRNRVFLASVLVAVASLAFALRYVTHRATRSAETQLRRDLADAAELVDRSYDSRFEALRTMARLVADLPVLKAAAAEGHVPTVEPVARDYATFVKAQFMEITSREGRVLAVVGPHAEARVAESAVRDALAGRAGVGFSAGPRGLLQVVTVPMALLTTTAPEVVGTLSLGLAIDPSLALDLRGVTESEVAFVLGDRLLATSLDGVDGETLRPALETREATVVNVAGNEYVALARPLRGDDGPRFVILRSRTERLRFLEPLRTALLAAAAAAVVGAVVLSFMISRTVTRPLAEITDAMREIARTGDFTRKVPAGTGFYDEDARVLTSAFNTLLDAVVRFQREAAQKERLSALGRLSTVIAHEVRNPLMIIKASLRGLTRPESSPEVRDAALDIDHEVARLNRTVTDVLDFSRPPRFEIQPTDLNAVCRDAAAAFPADDGAPAIRLDLGYDGGPLATDPDRLRTALVNVLGNARESGGGAQRADANADKAQGAWEQSSSRPPRPGMVEPRWSCGTRARGSPRPTCPTSSSPISRPNEAAPALGWPSRATSWRR